MHQTLSEAPWLVRGWHLLVLLVTFLFGLLLGAWAEYRRKEVKKPRYLYEGGYYWLYNDEGLLTELPYCMEHKAQLLDENGSLFCKYCPYMDVPIEATSLTREQILGRGQNAVAEKLKEKKYPAIEIDQPDWISM